MNSKKLYKTVSLLLLKKIKMYEYRKGGEEDVTDQQYTTLLQLLKKKKEGVRRKGKALQVLKWADFQDRL